MLISIITATYNSSSTIQRCVKSVEEQSWPEIEHLIIDGGSTDGTTELISSIPNRVRTLISEPDGGIYDAFNKGLRLAKGDIIGFLHADDCFASADTLRHIASAFASASALTGGKDSRPELTGTYGDLHFVGGESMERVVRSWRSCPFDRRRVKFGWTAPHPTIYLGRAVYAKHGFFDPSFRIAGDYDFILRVMNDPEVRLTYLPEVITLMSHGGASTGSLGNLLIKSREDLRALRNNGFRFPRLVLLAKILRKLPQIMVRSDP